MRKIKAFLAILCIVFAACAIVACGGGADSEESAKTTVAAPVISSKAYTGEQQAATIEESETYVVIENNGGTNAGEYSVVLKLTDGTLYEWENPDADDETKLTLKFTITKASNSISDLTLDGWRADETAKIPTANAEFGNVEYAYSTEQNGTYTKTVPAAAGTYYVKAYVEGTANYDGAESVISFEIAKAKEVNTLTVTVNDVKYGAAAPKVTASAAHVPADGEITYAYALKSDGEYCSWETIKKRPGKYYLKATVAEDNDYKGAFEIVEFEMLKGDNSIADFQIAAVTCKQAPALNATATARTTVTYKYATSQDGEYADIPADGLTAGTYYVKAYTAGDSNYASAESNPATLTVNHSYEWKTDSDGNDYRACVCGAEERFVITPAAGVLEKTESGYALKLYSAADGDKKNSVTISFTVTFGETETQKAAVTWAKSNEDIVEITGETEYTIEAADIGVTVLTATYTNAEDKKAHITIDVTVERVTKTVEIKHDTILAELTTTEIDLSFASAYIGDTVSLTYNNTVLGNDALTERKLTVDLSSITTVGEYTFIASSLKDNVIYTFNVNVILATKIIRTAEDMAAVRITEEQLKSYTPITGYYILANDIDFSNEAQLNYNYESAILKPTQLTSAYWNQNQGFRGTFNGNGKKILNVKVGQGGVFGYVGDGAIIKNVDFENVSYIGAYCGSLLGYSVINATIQNVNVSVSAYKEGSQQGLLNAKFTSGCKYIDITIDASEYEINLLFGKEYKSGTFSGVEIKVKSYTAFATNTTTPPEGVTVTTADTSAAA